MLEIALGSALMYYFTTQAFEIEKNLKEQFIILKLWILGILHLLVIIEKRLL